MRAATRRETVRGPAGRIECAVSACLVEAANRRVTVVDHAAFMSGVALAAGVSVVTETGGPVWSNALTYLEAATEMGLVMAEISRDPGL
jgi:hypothetical protein